MRTSSDEATGRICSKPYGCTGYEYADACKECRRRVPRQAGQAPREMRYTYHDEKYGYKLLPDNTGLEIDEYAANVVRRVFALASQGMSSPRIVDMLNNENIVSPAEHVRRMNNATHANGVQTWQKKDVQRMLQNTAYIGYTLVTDDFGQRIKRPFPAIVDETTFELANKKMRRGRGKTYMQRDVSAELSMADGVHKQDGTQLSLAILREKSCPLKTEAQQAILDALRQEKKRAQHAAEYVVTDEANMLFEECRESYAEEARALYDKQLTSVKRQMDAYNQMVAGILDPEIYRVIKKTCMEETMALETAFNRVTEMVDEYAKALSKDNPWIVEFADLKALHYTPDKVCKYVSTSWSIDDLLLDDVDTTLANRLIERFDVNDGRVVAIIQERFTRWRDILPEEWR